MSRIVVDPMWPLFGFMFGGAWLGWCWFILNAQAVGSPTRKKELLLVICGLGVTIALALLFGWLFMSNVLPREFAWTAELAVTLWKLGVTYWLYELQRRSFDLYRYFGGTIRSGFVVVLLGFFMRPMAAVLFGDAFWILVLI